MLTVEEAREKILQQIETLGTERVSILDAVGRICAEEVKASRRQPPWDNSAMDGYALRAADVVSASPEKPVTLTVLEDVMAGGLATRAVGAGQAVRIMTGAPMPRGADAVIRVELTRAPSRDRVEVLEPVPEGNDIRRAGEDQEPGDVLVAPGKLLRAAEVGVMAAAPRSWVRVVRAPVVGIIATGDELAEPDEIPGPGQIINTNAYSIAAMCREVGARPILLPIARDSREALRETFAEAVGCDVIISSGGVSVGEHDFVKEVLESLGVAMSFWKVKMTPGKPLAFGRWGHRPVFGLPGNPVSSMVTFELFVRPALLKAMGHTRIFRKMRRAILETPMQKRPGMPHFLRVTLREEGGQLFASSTGPQGSGVLRSMSRAEALAVGEEGLVRIEAGTEVWVMPLDEAWTRSETRVV